MFRSKMSMLVIGLSTAILGSILEKLAIDNRLPWQTAKANSSATKTEVDTTGKVLKAEAVKTQQGSKIAFQEALQIAETAANGKAYSMERETEDSKIASRWELTERKSLSMLQVAKLF